ncbi:hypothetical protein GCM10022198_13830 [Klugiella xanthotipulae]|uniref:N-acetyltransferase domain-containing protein n=1 Tax=Klugiella xanthotipulae TaxID=244735 RepID=A0A543I4R1_9MICO|nr:GNAT family N-acetyltransferase [Klugiella xanthotipulae]TQM65470.1 hypothetical protein FB466_0272 [Klugiella xanthotipulae]
MTALVTLHGSVSLRNWTDADLAPFAALNADPEVMAYFPGTLNREQSDALARCLGPWSGHSSGPRNASRGTDAATGNS